MFKLAGWQGSALSGLGLGFSKLFEKFQKCLLPERAPKAKSVGILQP